MAGSRTHTEYASGGCRGIHQCSDIIHMYLIHWLFLYITMALLFRIKLYLYRSSYTQDTAVSVLIQVKG